MRPILWHVCGLGHEVKNTERPDFETIEAAVMETERGRWFLAEYARRQRSADTQRLLEAIHKLESAIGAQVIPPAGDDINRELSAMAEALRSTDAEMRNVRNDRLADAGAVPEDRTAFEDVAARARNLAAGLSATTEALEKAGAALRDQPAVAARITGLDDDLARLDEHRLTQDVLSQRISKAMGLIVHLQAQIAASLGDSPAAAGQEDPAPAAADTLLDHAEVSYFEADRELFSAAEVPPAPSHDLVADDPENAPHLAGMLEEALASMPETGSEETNSSLPEPETVAPEPREAAAEAPETEAAIAATREPQEAAAEVPETETTGPVTPEPQEAAAEVPETKAEGPVVPEPQEVAAEVQDPDAPQPAATGAAATGAVATGATDTEAAAEPPAPRRVVIVRAAQPPAEETPAEPLASDAQAATASPETPPSPASGEAGAEPGPEAIMRMFSEAAARHGVSPGGDAAKETPAAPLESMTPGPEERRRIVVIRRNSSADSPIPLEETAADTTEAGKQH